MKNIVETWLRNFLPPSLVVSYQKDINESLYLDPEYTFRRRSVHKWRESLEF